MSGGSAIASGRLFLGRDDFDEGDLLHEEGHSDVLVGRERRAGGQGVSRDAQAGGLIGGDLLGGLQEEVEVAVAVDRHGRGGDDAAGDVTCQGKHAEAYPGASRCGTGYAC